MPGSISCTNKPRPATIRRPITTVHPRFFRNYRESPAGFHNTWKGLRTKINVALIIKFTKKVGLLKRFSIFNNNKLVLVSRVFYENGNSHASIHSVTHCTFLNLLSWPSNSGMLPDSTISPFQNKYLVHMAYRWKPVRDNDEVRPLKFFFNP